MTEPSPLVIRPGHARDVPGLVELFARAYGRSTNERHWNWKLAGRSDTVANVWLALRDEQPVFQYAGIGTRFLMSNRPVLGMVSVDTMTAPECRRQGLLTRVATEVYSHWKANGVSFGIGLPNEQWGSRLKALGWQELFPLRWLVRPLRPETFAARRLHLPLLNSIEWPGRLWTAAWNTRMRPDPGIATECAQQAGPVFDELWNACHGAYKFSAVHDREWVHWRFVSSPAGQYALTLARRSGRPVGYTAHSLVRTEHGTRGYLADLMAAPGDAGARNNLLLAVLKALSAAGADSLLTLAIPGSDRYAWLRRSGFFPFHQFPVVVNLFDSRLRIEELRQVADWNLSGADFDVV